MNNVKTEFYGDSKIFLTSHTCHSFHNVSMRWSKSRRSKYVMDLFFEGNRKMTGNIFENISLVSPNTEE